MKSDLYEVILVSFTVALLFGVGMAYIVACSNGKASTGPDYEVIEVNSRVTGIRCFVIKANDSSAAVGANCIKE